MGGRLWLLSGMIALPVSAADPIVVPSGQELRLQEVIQNTQGGDGLAIRYRFVAPMLTQDADFDLISADLTFLCSSYALPRLSAIGPQPSQIIISLADREVPFGDTDPEVIQYFGAYRWTGPSCEEEAL